MAPSPSDPAPPPRDERHGEDLRGVDWYAEEVAGTRFVRCDFSDADLTEARTTGAVFEECDFGGARFNASEHEQSAFLRCSFARTSWFGATLRGCKLTGSRFEGRCTLRPLTVERGDWSYVVLRGQDLSGLDLAGLVLAEADLTEADLGSVVLRDADLSRASLDRVTLRDADLRGARLDSVDLRGLDLTGVRLGISQAAAVATAYGAVVSWD